MDKGAKQLPNGWIETTLGEIAELVGGGTPSREHPEYFGGRHIWLTPTEIPRNRVTVVATSREKITDDGLKKSSARLLPKGTVLMTSRASIDYVAIAGAEVTTNQGFASFICKDDVYNHYLAYWLLGNVDFFIGQATGTTFKEITKSKLRNFSFPLPPLPEQKRIVAKIEELFTQLDAGMAALQRVKAEVKRYKASVLKAAVEGKLGIRNDEFRIQDDGQLPAGWKWSTVGEVAKVGTGSTPLRSNERYWKNGTIPWVTSGALNDLFVNEANEFVTEAALKETNVKIFPKGTLLVAMYGEGKTRGKVSELIIDATTNQACAALVF
ncbi:MAG: restriction endonuclease subunit S [Anaerolineales bacterium]|uniref:restriction endonuclease subunit S n=1 Tax=Candidatus Villigracilis proximus TaxID=3140683 RepID=UPI00313465C5|nr:restriction endonuclease subunit S [Anaerolineales bacterium]